MFRSRYIKILLILIISSIILTSCSGNKMGVESPEYPKKTSYEDGNSYEEINSDFLESLYKFSTNSTSLLLKEENNENKLYSPISLYMALSMVAEGAEGNTRDEILKALRVDDISMLREEMGKIFRNLYFENEIGKLKLANSIWLKENEDFKEEYLNTLSKDYYASSFIVDFLNSKTSKEIGDWISKETEGKLGSDYNGNFTDGTMMVLFNTIYLYDEWVDSFDEDLTQMDKFYLNNGETLEVEFMNRIGEDYYYRGDNYLAVNISLKNNGKMTFILPNEGVSPEELLSNVEGFSELTNEVLSGDGHYAGIDLKIPKFDYDVENDLMQLANKIGIKDAFSGDANFNNIIDRDKMPLLISQIRQKANIAIDEYGVEAAAYTEIQMEAASMPLDDLEKIEINLNRPFIYTITGPDNIFLFTGVVNNPKK